MKKIQTTYLDVIIHFKQQCTSTIISHLTLTQSLSQCHHQPWLVHGWCSLEKSSGRQFSHTVQVSSGKHLTLHRGVALSLSCPQTEFVDEPCLHVDVLPLPEQDVKEALEGWRQTSFPFQLSGPACEEMMVFIYMIY